MKLTSITRFAVASLALVGTVMVATSQPGGIPQAGQDDFPEHTMIPQKVSLGQMQEFKDAATLHLNDMLEHQMDGGNGQQLRGKKTKFNETTIIHTSVFLSAVNDTVVRYKEWSNALVGPSSGPMRPPTDAELAVLKFVFDKGVDMVGRSSGVAGGPSATASPAGIEAHISVKDMGLNENQFRQMVMQYAVQKQGRFWRDAASGLASGR